MDGPCGRAPVFAVLVCVRACLACLESLGLLKEGQRHDSFEMGACRRTPRVRVHDTDYHRLTHLTRQFTLRCMILCNPLSAVVGLVQDYLRFNHRLEARQSELQ